MSEHIDMTSKLRNPFYNTDKPLGTYISTIKNEVIKLLSKRFYEKSNFTLEK